MVFVSLDLRLEERSILFSNPHLEACNSRLDIAFSRNNLFKHCLAKQLITCKPQAAYLSHCCVHLRTRQNLAKLDHISLMRRSMVLITFSKLCAEL